MNTAFANELFSPEHTAAAPLLRGYSTGYDALPHIAEFIRELIPTLDPAHYRRIGDDVFVHITATVAESAEIHGPAVIGAETEVRQNAYIRGAALIGDGCVVGNACEVKNAILSDGVQIPHYNYVGDSILGYKAHMGAGSIASNFRADHGNITIHADTDIETGLRKMGALIGDFAEIGCNAVLCPGAIVGRRTIVYPLTRVRGVIPADRVYKSEATVVPRRYE